MRGMTGEVGTGQLTYALVKNLDFILGTMGCHGDIKQGWWIFVAVLTAQFLSLLPSWNVLFRMLLMGEYASVEDRGARSVLYPEQPGISSPPGWADCPLQHRSLILESPGWQNSSMAQWQCPCQGWWGPGGGGLVPQATTGTAASWPIDAKRQSRPRAPAAVGSGDRTTPY